MVFIVAFLLCSCVLCSDSVCILSYDFCEHFFKKCQEKGMTCVQSNEKVLKKSRHLKTVEMQMMLFVN